MGAKTIDIFKNGKQVYMAKSRKSISKYKKKKKLQDLVIRASQVACQKTNFCEVLVEKPDFK
jgi:hypothetical protein